MKKFLLIAAVLVCLGSIFAAPASAWSILGPWNPPIPGFGNGGACCAPVMCGPAYYCCPAPPLMKKKAGKAKAEVKQNPKKK